jgi:hypothetical protein
MLLTVYGERALVDYDFSKASLIVSVGADFLGDWQGGGDSGYILKVEFLKTENVTSLSIRGKHDFVVLLLISVWQCQQIKSKL